MINSRVGIWTVCVALLLAACTRDMPEGIDRPGGEEEAGTPVELSFDLGGGAATRAAQESMASGTKIQIYVYKKGAQVSGEPYAQGVYTVQSDLTATGEIKLYCGEYDIYLVSYNSSEAGDVPVLSSTDNKIAVGNGKDFMYLTLKGIRVQPDKAGGQLMTVSLAEPFTRMGTKVGISVCAPNTTQPVEVKSLEVVSVVLKGLPEKLSYILGNTSWEAAEKYESSYTYKGTDFEHQGTAWFDPWIADAQVLLPVVPATGLAELVFEVKLKVNNLPDVFTYDVALEKMLLPGMMYNFEFSLKFYGALTPEDLTIAVKEYDEIKVGTDDLGKD